MKKYPYSEAKVIHLASESLAFYETWYSFYLPVYLQTVTSRPLNMDLYYVKEENQCLVSEVLEVWNVF